jgi:hypothetical protein
MCRLRMQSGTSSLSSFNLRGLASLLAWGPMDLRQPRRQGADHWSGDIGQMGLIQKHTAEVFPNWIQALDLPQNGRLLSITRSIVSAMNPGRVRVCAEATSNCENRITVLQNPGLRGAWARSETAACSRTLDERTLRGSLSRNHADPGVYLAKIRIPQRQPGFGCIFSTRKCPLAACGADPSSTRIHQYL